MASTVALAMSVGALPSVALAAEPGVQEQVDTINARAVEKFQAKEYDEAVRLFEEAYDLQPEPNYLFNIGRIREEQGNLGSAVEYYERFVKEPRVPLEAREKGLERLRVLRAILEETAVDEPEPVEQNVEEPVEPNVEEPVEEIVEEPESEPDEPEPERGPSRLRIAGYVLLGTGAAGLGTAGVLAGLALSRANALEDQHTFEERNETIGGGQDLALGADIMFGVGGALAVTGLVLVIVSVKRKPTEAVARRARLSPWASRRGGGVAATLRF
ncbi:MAG: tetratricopeptide repeat protein [Nannocystaceae bacterium]